jgi:hypothetical protein
MITKPKVRKRRIAKILAGGGTSLTNSLDRLPPHVAEAISSQASLDPEEEPLVASFLRSDHWCLATTSRFIWRDGDQTAALRWEEIRDVRLTDSDWRLLFDGLKPKDTLKELLITDGAAKEHSLILAPGSGFLIIWSVLLALCARKPSTSR